MTAKHGPIVGIDLGTTNSVVAAVIDGRPQVLEENGRKILPSVVGINQAGELITGEEALNQLAAFPEHTIASIKRRMGDMQELPLGEEKFTPPEVSAMILRRLRDRATRALGEDVTRAVITVPAFFNESQRQATREAGELAGLQVERIINEPTAAALIYHAGSQDRKEILVYDFGGGTFDVSIVRMEAGVIEVLSSKGDTQLGGDDIDALLMNYTAGAFEKETGVDLRGNPGSRHRLLQACRQAKQQLSTLESVQIVVEFVASNEGEPLNLNQTISRQQFEEMIAPLVDRTIESVDEAIREAGVAVQQIQDMVLVGGSTRIPLVAQRLREEYYIEPSRSVDPDLAVALGAAVQAAKLDGDSTGPVLVDVIGHTLGIEAVEGQGFGLGGPETVTSPIIHRNTPLPARFEQSYYKMYDDQERADIHVLQGEHIEVERNHSIGRFSLALEPGGGSRTKIVVRFDLTLDGTLQVTATQPATGKSEDLVINNALTRFQKTYRKKAEARLGQMFESSGQILDASAIPAKQTPDPGNQTTENSSQQFPGAQAVLEKSAAIIDKVGEEDASEIKLLSKQLQQAMADSDADAAASISRELDDILFYVQ